jgi:hypothetical protein
MIIAQLHDRKAGGDRRSTDFKSSNEDLKSMAKKAGVALAFALTLSTAPALAQPSGVTCETRSDIRHCWDNHGNTVVTEERSGEYVHGHDNHGHTWTTWEHDGRTYTWPTR